MAKRTTWLGVISLCAAAVACTVGTYSVQATRLQVVNKSDIPIGDEPYIGSVRFRSQFGLANSTVVEVEASLNTLGDNVREGSWVNIPAEIGSWDVNTVALMSKADIFEDGRNPGIGGVLYLAMEQDHVGKPQVRDRLNSLAQQITGLLVKHVEGNKWSELAVPLALQRVQEGLTASTGGDCGLLNTRICRFFTSRIGDDFIGSASVLYVGLEDAYFKELEPKWKAAAAAFGQAWPGCSSTTSPVCSIASRTHVLDLDDPSTDGHYRMELVSTFR